MGLQANVFPITNLAELSSAYRMYRIRGLAREHKQYHHNLQTIARKASYALKTPAVVVMHDDQPHLVVRDDSPEPPSPLQLVRCVAYFDPLPGIRQLDYTVRNAENDAICLRFLQFMLQAPVNTNPQLWQPGSGMPFFNKKPAQQHADLCRYVGFSVRAVQTTNGGFGLCVDACNKIVSSRALPARMTLQEFRTWRGRHYIYHYGHKWYEIRPQELSDLIASEFLVPRDGQQLPILDYITVESEKPVPQELATLPHDASVAVYTTSQNEYRGAPTGLCYVVYGTDEAEARPFHSATIIHPRDRRTMILGFVRENLTRLQFGSTRLAVSETPIDVPQNMFVLPDYEFGRSRFLSVRGTKGAQQVSLDQVGRARASLLRDRQAGFYIRDRLDRQYLLLPQTVADSFGSQFVTDLRASVDELFPEGAYEPIVATYTDRCPRTFVEQGRAILAAARQLCTKPGYALVMIHHTTDRLIRTHDQLAAMVVRELRKLDICAAVNHSAMGSECYELVRGRDGRPTYRVRENKRPKFFGYLRGVALNKVLLTNERWPFVLATPLHAGLTIGIDVKVHTAGFTSVAGQGHLVRTICRESNQKEHLSADLIKKCLMEIVRREAADSGDTYDSIVIHRDGRLWDSEIDGLRSALRTMKDENLLSPDARFAALEIPKSAPARLRVFDVTDQGGGRIWVDNPQVGCHWLVNQSDAYLCATGRAFPRKGTVRPLHVRYVDGDLPFVECLEDLYCLTALTWTRPEDCTRYPITIKLTDRRLGEDASEYDVDALEFHESEPEEELA